MGIFDSIGDWANLLNTGVTAINAYNSYSAMDSASNLANKQFDTIAGSTAKQDAIAQELFDRYKTTYWPLEDKQIALQDSWMQRYTPEIQQKAWDNYDAELQLQPQYQQIERGIIGQASMTPQEWGRMFGEKAHQDVQTSFDAQRGQAQRALSRMGVDPTSGRSITALQSGMGVNQSLADVGAQTGALQQGYDTAWNRGAGALGFRMGNTIPQQTSAPSGTALGSMATSALGAANSANQVLLNSALASTAAGSKGFGAATSALLGTGQGSLQKGFGALNNLSGYQ